MEIREGDALETLSVDLPETIDLVLLDGAKSLYPEILSLLESRQFAERLGFAVGHAPRGRAYGLGEIGDRRGVKAVGLGALAGRAGEVSRI